MGYQMGIKHGRDMYMDSGSLHTRNGAPTIFFNFWAFFLNLENMHIWLCSDTFNQVDMFFIQVSESLYVGGYKAHGPIFSHLGP